MAEPDKRSELERRLLRRRAAPSVSLDRETYGLLFEAAEALGGLRRAGAADAAICVGCGGTGFSPSPEQEMEAYPVIRLPCTRCAAIREALESLNATRERKG